MELAGIEISHPDKTIFPGKGITKGQMLEYYDRIADRMLPYLKDRPLTLQRYPEGINKDGFYQKNAADYFPDFIERIKVSTNEGENVQLICNSKKALIYLANQGTLCFHIWLSRKDKLHKPDKVIFDLDPPEGAFAEVKECARKIKSYLLEQGEDPQLMTSGKSGLHVYYQKRRSSEFDRVREKARQQAQELAQAYPDLMTTETRIAKRQGRIFIDYLRNAYAQTAVCPYSLRPNPTAGVATPLKWDELVRVKSGDHYHIGNIFRRLSAI